MSQVLGIICGSCGARFDVSMGQAGGVYECPACRHLNRAARRVEGGLAQERSWDRNPWIKGVLVGAVGFLVLQAIFGGNETKSSGVDDDLVNQAAFLHIADAHGEYFRASAQKTRLAFSQMEQAIKATEGRPQMDPRIREFAQMQAAYESVFGQYVATEQEALSNPARLPVELWVMQRQYHQKVRELCAIYQPEWVSGLDERIAQDNEIIRRLKARH